MITLRIPTKDQYAYVEETIDEEIITPKEIKARYDELYNAMNAVKTPEIGFYDYLVALFDSNLKEWGSVEFYEQLSPREQAVLQAIKRYYKRLK